jgi:integrase
MGGNSGLKGISIRNNHIRIIIHHKKTRPKPFATTLKIKPTPANLKYAQRQREAWLHQLELGQIPEEFQDEQKASSLTQLLNDWLDSKSNSVKASTLDDYTKSVKILKEQFGHLDASQLTIGMIRDFCTDLGVTAKRVNNLISPLRQSLQRAVEDELIPSNILTGWSFKKTKELSEEDEIDPFTSDEQLAIYSVSSDVALNLVMFIFWTGLRPSEYIALKWSDVDFVNETVSIKRALTQSAAAAELPKTSSSKRTIKLLPAALTALKKQKAFTYLSDQEIFLNEKTGKPFTGDQQIRKTFWTPLLKKAGVRYRYPYQTRHTYASMMLSAGEHPMWVAKQMGHSDWSMIARRYGKWMPEAMPDAGEKAVQKFGSFLDRFGGDLRGFKGRENIPNP